MNSYDIFSNYLRMVYCLIVNMQSRNRIIKKVVSVVLFLFYFVWDRTYGINGKCIQ